MDLYIYIYMLVSIGSLVENAKNSGRGQLFFALFVFILWLEVSESLLERPKTHNTLLALWLLFCLSAQLWMMPSHPTRRMEVLWFECLWVSTMMMPCSACLNGVLIVTFICRVTRSGAICASGRPPSPPRRPAGPPAAGHFEQYKKLFRAV